MGKDQTSAQDRLAELVLVFVKKLISEGVCPGCGGAGSPDLEYHWHDQAWVDTQYYRSAETARSIPSFGLESAQPHIHFSCRQCQLDWFVGSGDEPVKTLLAAPVNAPLRLLLSDGQPPAGTVSEVEELAQRWQAAGLEIIGFQVGPLPETSKAYQKSKRAFPGGI